MFRTGLTLVSIFLLVLVAGCGRSSLHSVDLVDVTVGLTSSAGTTLTEVNVATALDPYGFALSRFDSAQWCGQEPAPCVWAAEGTLPTHQMQLLMDHQDHVMSVVYVEPIDPAAELPENGSESGE